MRTSWIDLSRDVGPPEAMRFRIFAVVASIVGLGCSSSSTSNGGTSSADSGALGADSGAVGSDSGSTTDPTTGWVITDALSIEASVYCLLTSAQTVDDCTTLQSVTVYDTHTTSNVSDAVVTVSLDGQAPISLTHASGSQAYTYSSPKLPKTYRYDITRGADHAVVTGTAPADFALTLSPSPPTVSTASTLTWTSIHDPEANEWGINVKGTSTGNSAMASYMVSDDSGTYPLPTTAFPQAGQYAVTLYKGNLQQLYGPTQLSEEQVVIQLQHELDVTAH